MKENKKKEITLEQKIYGVLLGVGILALVGLTVLYGKKSQQTGELVEQNIELGEQNPVSGQVASTESTTEVAEATEEAEDTMKIVTENTVNDKINVSSYNGIEKLSWPVTGNVLIPYSMDTTVYFETLDQYQCNPALYIKADTGTQVKAMYGGIVTKVEKTDRYGQLLTIDMGNGYEASYGQMSDITYKEGDTVKTGDVLGKIAEPTDYFILEGSHLYLKMTKDDKAVNPTEYFEP